MEIIWPLRRRLRRPTALVWTVLALLGAGRFVEFFVRSDSDPLALGLVTAQWVSLLLVVLARCGRGADGAASASACPA